MASAVRKHYRYPNVPVQMATMLQQQLSSSNHATRVLALALSSTTATLSCAWSHGQRTIHLVLWVSIPRVLAADPAIKTTTPVTAL